MTLNSKVFKVESAVYDRKSDPDTNVFDTGYQTCVQWFLFWSTSDEKCYFLPFCQIIKGKSYILTKVSVVLQEKPCYNELFGLQKRKCLNRKITICSQVVGLSSVSALFLAKSNGIELILDELGGVKSFIVQWS